MTYSSMLTAPSVPSPAATTRSLSFSDSSDYCNEFISIGDIFDFRNGWYPRSGQVPARNVVIVLSSFLQTCTYPLKQAGTNTTRIEFQKDRFDEDVYIIITSYISHTRRILLTVHNCGIHATKRRTLHSSHMPLYQSAASLSNLTISFPASSTSFLAFIRM